jgi:hypothetical protein
VPTSKYYEIPLTGKFLTGEPATIGNNFRTLDNLRYTDTHLKGVQGYTKINTPAMATYLKTRNSFQFIKSQPSESHLLAEAYDTAISARRILTNDCTIPSAGHFNELMTLDVAPATEWLEGETITGATSLKSCVIVKVLTTTTYIVKGRTGTFTLGEVLSNGTVTADQGAANPTFSLYSLYTPDATTSVGSFINVPDGQIAYCNGVDTCMWGGYEMPVTAFLTSTAAVGNDGTATSPKDYSIRMQNTKTDTNNLATIAATNACFLVGSPRPLQGVKLYVQGANATSSTMTGSYWSGAAWTALSGAMALTDFTDVTASLARTGWVTFPSTVATAKPKYIEGYYLYWYQFTVSAGSATLYKVTLDAPFQSIIDLWDGVYTSVSAAFKRTTSILDQTLNVLKEDYDTLVPDTYMNLSSMAAFSTPANTVEVGFADKQTGLYIKIPPEYTNSTAATTMAIDYWDGAAYQTVGDVSDGTSEGSISLAKSGIVTWNNADVGLESRTNKLLPTASVLKTTAVPLFFYRIRFDKAMDATMRVDYIGGITIPITMTNYKFPVFAQGRLLLCNDTSGEKNKVTCSAKYMPQVFNGEDSADVYFGDDEELTCGIELYSQFGGNLFSLIMMFKRNEIWLAAGQDITTWSQNIFPLSLSVGCPAPRTLKVLNLQSEITPGTNRSLCIWQGANGIYMSDGRAPIPIHNDIKEYFDRNDSRCIKASLLESSVSFVDLEKQEYHWLFASGSSATALNKELVYDINRMKWFSITRATALQCGVSVDDSYGNQYTYGFLDTGYIERLEYGTTFDGSDITHTFQTGDFMPQGLSATTQLDKIKLMTVAKTSATTDITMSHYADTLSTSTDRTMSQNKTGYRIADPKIDEKLQGEPFHSLKFVVSTNNETTGFEPIAVIATVSPLSED